MSHKVANAALAADNFVHLIGQSVDVLRNCADAQAKAKAGGLLFDLPAAQADLVTVSEILTEAQRIASTTDWPTRAEIAQTR